MKSLSLSLGGLALIANIAILALLTDYPNIVTIMSSCVILTTALLIFTSSNMSIKDGFKISLPFLFTFVGLIEYILSFFVFAKQMKNNGFLIAIILLFLFQIFCLIIVKIISDHD